MTINCKGTLVDLSIPKVMGILNITPDSFYDGGKYKSDSDILNHTEKMINDGADFIDIGAYSSRPGAADVSEEEEISRSLATTELLLKKFPDCLISIDTFRANVAAKNIEAGAAVINDISAGLLDDNMIETAGRLQVPYIMMHMKGTPQNMQQNISYEDLIREMLFYFSERVHAARAAKISDIIIDPGFGFAKTLEDNYHILANLELFEILELPMLIGLSRKSMIYKLLDTNARNALTGTIALNMLALQKKASILRVHDVKEAVTCIRLHQELLKNA